jgi:uncharacterized protein (TIGR02284 family)
MGPDKNAISTLNSLIETCNDGAKGFETAAKELRDSSARQLFQQYAQERSQFADELRAEVQRLGGRPEEGGSVSGAVHRGWMNIKDAVAGHDDKAIIAEAERGEDVAVASYQSALKEGLPADVEPTVRRQFGEVKAAHDRVRDLERRYES